jgi:hypothetical protein
MREPERRRPGLNVNVAASAIGLGDRTCSREWILDFEQALSVELRSWLARGFLELAIDSQLNAADCQEVYPGFRLAGLDLVAEPELPFPGARRYRRCNRVFHALVIHGLSPPRLAERILGENESCTCSISHGF